MDSEQSAYLTAQQKHHRYMIFGKKHRYIEVFQCSGEDMNLVLTGGIPAPVSPAKAAPALLSPGMLPPLSSLPPPTSTNLPPPPPPNTTVAQISQNLVQPNPSLSWENPTLYAQQQAQMIAQQNLLARQNQAQVQNDLMLMNQIAHHNLAVLNSGGGQLSPNNSPGAANPQLLKSAAAQMQHVLPHMAHMPQQHPFLVRMAPSLGIPRPPVAYQHLLAGAPPPMYPVMPHMAVKRSYGDAFAEQSNSAAKRAFQPGAFSVYPQFYPNI